MIVSRVRLPLAALFLLSASASAGSDVADPVGKGKFNNSVGLMYDPSRKLVWAVGENSALFVMRLDASRVTLHAPR
jgi:hypothetical protein